MNDPEKPVTSFVVNRAQEPTTYAGIVSGGLAAYLAYKLGDWQSAIAGVAAVIGGLVSVFSKQKRNG